jgi:hypothetical protein
VINQNIKYNGEYLSSLLQALPSFNRITLQDRNTMIEIVQILLFVSVVYVSSASALAQGKGSGSIVSPYQKDDSGGSGQFKAAYKADPSLPKHTIYYLKTSPDFPMPIIVWGEGETPLIYAFAQNDPRLIEIQVHVHRKVLLC